jgi:hypothetical protein
MATKIILDLKSRSFYRCNSKYKVDYVKFEVVTAVTMKNVVFWDIKTQFVLHRRHFTSPLQSPAG